MKAAVFADNHIHINVGTKLSRNSDARVRRPFAAEFTGRISFPSPFNNVGNQPVISPG